VSLAADRTCPCINARLGINGLNLLLILEIFELNVSKDGGIPVFDRDIAIWYKKNPKNLGLHDIL
jgi:hypothetical protein